MSHDSNLLPSQKPGVLPAGITYDSIQVLDINKTPFLVFQTHRDDYYNMSQDSVKGVVEESVLSKLFFSPKNVERIQKMLIKEVFKRTKGAYLIPKQEEKDLQIVMRSMFLQHAKNVKNDILGQVRELNLLTIDDLVPNVISELQFYVGYLERAFGPRQILDRPESTSNAGTKSIPSVTKFFGERLD
jgi:hypothetical protein